MKKIFKFLLTASFSLSFTVIANSQTPEAPQITCPGNITKFLDENCTVVIQFTGAIVTGYPTPTVTYSGFIGSYPEGFTLIVAGAPFVGQHTITVIATNSIGSVSCTFTITIIDNTPPFFTFQPTDITVNTEPGLCTAQVTGQALVVENCSSVNLIELTSTFPVGTYPQTFTAIDGSGNTATYSRTVTVIDNEPPVISNCQNITVNAYLTCEQVVTYSPNATDNCNVTVQTSVPSGSSFPVGSTTINVTATDGSGNTATCSFVVTVLDKGVPTTSCISEEKMLILDQNCEAVLPDYRNLVTGYDNCPGEVIIRQNPEPGTILKGPERLLVGFIPIDAAGNTETKYICYFRVNVIDNIPPVITECPANITVDALPGLCTATVTNLGNPKMADNCTDKYFYVSKTGDAANDIYSVGATTIIWTVTDESGNTATCSQTVVVRDTQEPTITNESASISILSPPNHQMHDVTINYTISDNCGASAVLTVISNEPVNGTGDGDTDPDWVVVDDHHVKLRAERAAHGDGRIYTIIITAGDGTNTVSKSVEVRVAHDIRGPITGHPFKVGSTVDFNGVFWDKPTNKHTVKWLIDDKIAVKGVVTEPTMTKNGEVTGSYKFTTAGVYKLQMNITDQNGITSYANTNGDLESIVVIYDPNGGHTYGGGYFNSPAGALGSAPSATGKASYGFAMNYFKNSTNPKGETQFEFKVGDFEFNALNFDYLVINNAMAQFKGTGKIIGGQSGVGFTMTVTDGQLDGSGVDKIRMKIYNKNNGSIIYDNQPGESDAALPVQAVGTNSIVVISGNNANLTSANTNQKAEIETSGEKASIGLDVMAFPNPSATNFTINVKENTIKGKIIMQVIDMYGRVIETRNVSANSMIRFGERYRPGAYFVRIMQGKEHKEIKLLKLSD